LVKKAVEEVERVREDGDLGGAYMTWAMNLQDEHALGLEEGIQIGEARGREKGIQIGEARGREKGIQQGILGTLISLVLERMLPYEVGQERSGLSEAEFRAKIAEVDPHFQR
jgi:flagellar biosynthesis/type III secretory pathway protein FliH